MHKDTSVRGKWNWKIHLFWYRRFWDVQDLQESSWKMHIMTMHQLLTFLTKTNSPSNFIFSQSFLTPPCVIINRRIFPFFLSLGDHAGAWSDEKFYHLISHIVCCAQCVTRRPGHQVTGAGFLHLPLLPLSQPIHYIQSYVNFTDLSWTLQYFYATCFFQRNRSFSNPPTSLSLFIITTHS